MRQLLATNSVAVVVQSIRIAAVNRHRPIDVARSVAGAETAIHIRTGRDAGAVALTIRRRGRWRRRRRRGFGCRGVHSDFESRTRPPPVLRMATFTASQGTRRSQLALITFDHLRTGVAANPD
jgi:hypothetical protein